MKISSIIFCLLLAFLLICGASPVLADDFRCGSYIISPGARKSEILSKCGNPSNIEAWEEVYYLGDRGYNPIIPIEAIKLYVTIEEWEYNLGPNIFIRYLRFENARLLRITTGDYGY